MLERLSCRDVRAGLEAYTMGELDAAREDLYAVHLMSCTACAAEAGLAERVDLELAALPLWDAPPELIERIKTSAREESAAPVAAITSRRPRQRARWRPAMWPAALAAMLLAALALSLWRSPSRPAFATAIEIAQAEQEARYALALVARLGRKASAEVRDEVFIERVVGPLSRSLSRAAPARPAKPGGLES